MQYQTSISDDLIVYYLTAVAGGTVLWIKSGCGLRTRLSILLCGPEMCFMRVLVQSTRWRLNKRHEYRLYSLTMCSFQYILHTRIGVHMIRAKRVSTCIYGTMYVRCIYIYIYIYIYEKSTVQLASVGGCPAVVVQWQSTGGSSQRCPGFNYWRLPAFLLSSIFTS